MTSIDKSVSAMGAVIAVVAVALAALLVAPSVSALWQQSGASGSSDLPAPAMSSGTVAPTGATTQVAVSVDGMSFSPNVIEVPAGNSLEVVFTNTGDQRHDLVFANGAATSPVAPGASETVAVGVIGSDLEGWCSLPGHRQMGMTLTVVAVDSEAHVGHSSPTTTTPTMSDLVKQAKAEKPHPAALGALPQDTEHRFTFEVSEDERQLAEGVVVPLWTYNGSSPGPTLHGKVGDTFIITLINQGTMGHSIDFHAGDIAPDQPMRTIEPGQSLEYRFEAKRSGIWMYHCSTAPMSTHIARGMFGAVVIEPEGLPGVDRSYVLVQSDGYVDDDNLVQMKPEYMSFNGRPFQYDAHPLPARVGERVRVWVLAAGPNEALSFHVVGGQFDTVWSEGGYSLYRGQSVDGVTQGETGAQVLPLLAAQGGFVEFVPLEAGRYPFVNHIMSLAEKGAHGIFEVAE